MTALQQPAGNLHTPRPEKREGYRGTGEARPCKARWEIQHLQPWHKVLGDSEANTEWKETLVSQ